MPVNFEKTNEQKKAKGGLLVPMLSVCRCKYCLGCNLSSAFSSGHQTTNHNLELLVNIGEFVHNGALNIEEDSVRNLTFSLCFCSVLGSKTVV